MQHFLGLDQQLGHQLQGVVLEGAGRTVPKLNGVQTVVDLDRLPCLAAEGCAVGGGGGFAQEVRRVVGQKSGEDLFCQLGVRKLFPAGKIRLGEGLRHKQPALGGKPTDDRLSGTNAERRISGTYILHNVHPFILKNRPLYTMP